LNAHRPHGWALACVVAALWLAPVGAHAQPSEGHVVAQRARGYAIAGRCDLAIPIFDRAIELEPSQPDLVRDRGACHERLGHRDLAWQDYTAYCDAAGDAADVPAVRRRIEQLEAPSTPPPTATPTPGAATDLLPPVASHPDRNEDPFYTPSSEKPSEEVDNPKKPVPDEVPVPSGFEVGLRVGYSIPFGTEASTGKMSDLFSGTVPLWGDVGFRMAHPNLFVGGYFQYAIGFVGGATARGCQGGVKCYAGVLMYGLQAQYHPFPTAPIDPWVGIGVGIEDVKLSVSEGGPSSVNSSVNGWDFALLQLGGDFHGIGPLVMFGVGEYTGLSASGQSTAIPGQSQTLHEWLTLGLRGVYDVAP